MGLFNSISKKFKVVSKVSEKHQDRKGNRQNRTIWIFSLLNEKKTKGRPIAKIKKLLDTTKVRRKQEVIELR
jgi:hypothetical protein